MKTKHLQIGSKCGFTLIEVLVVIAILGILASLVSGNLINSMKRGRDAKRKEDLQQIKNALDMYYEDNSQYPPSLTFGGQLKHPTIDAKVYMQKLPQDPNSGYIYIYQRTGVPAGKKNAYRIFTTIENKDDKGPGIAPNYSTGYAGTTCCSTCPAETKSCKFGISSPNITMDGAIVTE